MARFRGRVPDFELANPIYVGAQVTFFEADTDGVATSTVATLYAAPTGSATVSNPQTLDSEGKLEQPIYIETPVVGSVTGALAGPHTTGAIAPRGTHKGNYAGSVRLSSGDTVRDASTGSFYAASNDFTTTGTLATDVSAGNLEVIVDASQILTDLTASFAKAIDLPYTFSATTSMADPGAGTIRLNNATLSSVTAIALDDTSAQTGNPDVSAYLTAWDDSTNPVKGYVLVRETSAPQNFAIYRLTSLTDNSGWVELAVTHVASNGSFSADDVLTISFSRTGDQGDTVGAGLIYNFDDATAMADPGAGEVRLNNAAFGSVTAVAISDNTASTGNPDVSAYLLTWDDSTAANKGLLILKKVGAPQNFAIYRVTSLTDNAGWVQLAVTHVASAGSFSASDELSVEFITTVGAAASASVQDVSTNTTLAVIDAGKVLRCTAAVTLSLTAAATLTNGWYVFIHADGGAVTIDPDGAETVNGVSTITVPQENNGLLFCSGSAFYFFATGRGAVLLDEAASAPATDANQGALYTKEVNGRTELFFREESSGTEVQITSGGNLRPTTPTQTRLTSGSGTYNTPAGCRAIRVRLVGGGGGGGGPGGTASTNGGNTTFGSLTGGGGAGASSGAGAGGTATGGDINIAGAYGDAAGSGNDGGASGGATPFGGAGAGATRGGNSALSASANTGSGGGGASVASASPYGGGGAGGYVEDLIEGPDASYSYAVGAAGSGNAGGSTTGGNGGSGIIIIDEYY